MNFITIPGFENLSRQEIFNISVRHVLANGKKSMNDQQCVYSGIGCAAAPFIREEERQASDGRCSSMVGGSNWANLRSGGYVPDHHVEFIQNLQQCHDNSSDDDNFIDDFKDRARAFALHYELKTDVLNT